MRDRKFKVNGLTLNCLDYGGEGNPPMLFIHGGSAHAHWFDFVGPAFTDRFHSLSLDLRGHGDSEWPPDWAYGTRHYISDLEELIGTWGLGAPVMVGHSMGGHTVMTFATRHPELLRAMIAIDAPADYPDRAVDFLRTVGEKPARRFDSLEHAMENFRLLPRETLAKKEILAHAARHTFKPTGDGGWTHKMDRRASIREPINVGRELSKITCPALIVKVQKSQFPDRESARAMAASMAQGSFAEVPDSYHHVTFDNPDALIAVMKEFLATI
jgi:pimeloyl-ACP methyl ester carboxylesterase